MRHTQDFSKAEPVQARYKERANTALIHATSLTPAFVLNPGTSETMSFKGVSQVSQPLGPLDISPLGFQSQVFGNLISAVLVLRVGVSSSGPEIPPYWRSLHQGVGFLVRLIVCLSTCLHEAL